MSFIDCIVKQMTEGQLKDFEARDIQRRYAETYNQAKADGLSDADATLAAQNRIEADKDVLKGAVNLRASQRVALHKINQYFKNSKLPAARAVEKYLQTVVDRSHNLSRQAFGLMTDETLAVVRPDLIGRPSDPAMLRAAIGHIVDGTYPDTKAGRIGKNLNEINKYMVSEYKLAGLELNELDNYIPPVHNKKKITNAGEEAWVQDMKRLVGEKTRTNPETGVRFSDAELDEFLRASFRSIADGNKQLKDTFLESAELRSLGAPQARAYLRKRNHQRFIHFDSAEAFFEYNQKYGKGDEALPAAIFANIESMATDIAIAQKLGVSPSTGMNFIKQKIEADPKSEGLIRGKKYYIKKAEQHYNALRATGLDQDDFVEKYTATLLNATRSAQLGMASLSAIPDVGLARSAAYLKGANANRVVSLYAKGLMAGNKAQAARASYIADAMAEVFRSGDRLSGEIGKTRGFFAGTASAVNKLSFLTHITRNVKQVGVLETLAKANDTASVKWGDLDGFWKDALSDAGIDSRQWDELNKYASGPIYNVKKSAEHGDASFLDTNALRKIALEEGNFTLRDVANNIDDLGSLMAALMSNEGTLATRALLSGERLGGNIMSRVLLQYQSFPMSVLFNHLIPHLNNARKGKGLVGFADSFLITTMLGYASIIAKDVFSGKTKPDMFDEEGVFNLNETTLKRAIIQGGAGTYLMDLLDVEYGGIKGDYLKNVVWEFTGGRPVPSLVLKSGDAFLAKPAQIGYAWLMEDDEAFEKNYKQIKKQSGQLLMRNIPFGNLFYIRAVVDSLLFDGIRQLTDEDYEENKEKFLQGLQEREQDLWISPDSGLDIDKLTESFSVE